MTDPDLLEKKLAFIETCVSDLRRLAVAAAFRILARAGRISQELALSLSAAPGFRNVLMHGYTEVDSRVTRDVLENHLGELLDFARVMRSGG